ncbi:hypothetical protein [uncultured Caulobacter sp.]|uniref:hypothetical protein n=1 Tax=uncultured Caulobacter sp. TaxID=158749 RepID=UPI00261A463F|nr:hypothetical protein [uncultured Caulobacter sp.]
MAGRTDLEQLVYQVGADLRRLEKANERVLGNVKDTTRKAQREYDQLAADMGRGFGKASLTAGLAFGAIVGYATKAASDASETANAFEVAFGKLTPQAQKFAVSYSKTVGRALDETQANMAKTQLILTGIGINADKALGLTEAIQKRSVDIGSLFNVEDAEAYQAIISGISGEAEPLKKFGVALNETAVKAELLKLGFKGNAEQAPEAAKAIARLNIIMRGTAQTEGDAIRTKDGLANATKAAQGAFRNAAAELGKSFLPVATDAAKAATALLTEFNKMPDGVKIAGLAFLGLVAAGGPIAALIEGLAKVIKFANAARGAVAAAAGAQAAASAAQGATQGAAAGTAARLGLGGAALSGSLVLGGVAYGAIGIKGAFDAVAGANRVKLVNQIIANPSMVRDMSGDDIAKLQALLRRDQSRKGEYAQTMYGDFGADTTPARRALGILAGEMNARKDAAAKQAETDLSFDLPEDLKRALAGSGSGGKKKGVIDLKTKTIAVDEDTIFDLVNNLGGIANAITKPDGNPDGFVSSEDRMADIREALDRSRAETQAFWADTIEGGLWAAFEEGGPGVARYFARQLAAETIHNLASGLAKKLTSGGGDLGKVGSFFAGFFADGGTIPAGQWGIVNDGGVEAVRAKPGGGIEVMNNRALTAAAGLNRPAASRVVVHDRVVKVVTEASPLFDTRVEQVAAPGAVQAARAGSEAGAAKAVAQARVDSRYRIAR